MQITRYTVKTSLVFSLHFTLGLRFTLGLQFAVRGPQSAFFPDRGYFDRLTLALLYHKENKEYSGRF